VKGTVVYLYAFDVANEIRTSQVGEVLSQKPFPFQIRVGTTAPRDVPLYRPLTIGLQPVRYDSSVGPVTLKPFVKLFDVGVLSISYEVAFEVTSLGELVPYHQLRVPDGSLTELAERLSAQVAESLRPYMVRPTQEHPSAEAYTVFCLEGLQGTARDWVSGHRAEIAALLNEESDPARLAATQVDETLRHALSYTSEDVAVIDWDAALVTDPAGYYDDVLYMIELANLQLEEYRLLDDRLDRLFLTAYEDLDRYYRSRIRLWVPEKRLLALRSYRMDITKMSEELSNITKYVGDWYLARVYLACKDRFHLAHWEASVDQKLLELDRVYSIVRQETTERRMLLLEAMIVGLFIFDVIALFLLKK
jgi:hypothetical protein